MQTQRQMTAREFADRVLSGLQLHIVPAIVLDPSRRELKMCEICPRTFTRPIGSTKNTCGCELHRVRKPKTRYREPLIRNFDATRAGTSRAYRQGRRTALAN